jgi:outer membrane protein TolC
MAAANAQIGIAYAAYYPTVTLSAQNGFESNQFGTLFKAANHIWSIGPSVSETVFDAGLRNATVRQTIATYNADLAAYRANVLTAFQQVEDSLAQVRILSKQLIQQRQAEQSAEQFLTLEMSRYQTGIDPYVNVVTAQTTLLADQQAVITVQILEMTEPWRWAKRWEAVGISHNYPLHPRLPKRPTARRLRFNASKKSFAQIEDRQC